MGATWLRLHPGVELRYQHLVGAPISVPAGIVRTGSLLGDRFRFTSVLTGVEWHPLGKGLRGLYLSPRVGLDWYWFNEEFSRPFTCRRVAFAAVAGWRWVGGRGLQVAAGAGVRAGCDPEFSDTYVEFRPELTVGWAF